MVDRIENPPEPSERLKRPIDRFLESVVKHDGESTTIVWDATKRQ